MGLTTNNLYHPYTNDDLGFFLHGKDSKDNATRLAFEEIDLYSQPVEEPVAAFAYFALNLVYLIVGEGIQFKILGMAKKENGLVKQVTEFYSIVTIAILPIWVLITSGTDFIYPLNEVLGQWFCTITWVLTYFHFNVMSFQSFIVAMMRYLYLVHEEKVKKYGIEKTKRLFLVLTITIPMVLIIWSTIEHYEVDPMLYMNRCNNIHHKVFLSDLSGDALFMCDFEVAEGYGIYQNLVKLVKKVSCVSRIGVILLMGCNLSEAILYYKIFAHSKK